MTTKSYNALEGTLSVTGANTASRTGTADGLVIVGGYDSSNAASGVNASEVTEIDDPSTAEDEFGDSELARLAAVAGANGVGTMYGVPVEGTEVTGEDPSSGTSGELANAPIFNPDLHPNYDITDQNGNDIFVSYDPASETIDGTEGYVNPVTGDFNGDSGTTYSLDYTHGDYTTAIQAAVDTDARYVLVGTENSSVKSTLVTELGEIAADFDFKRGFVGAEPAIDSANVSNYSPAENNWRLVEVAPALATGSDGAVRTAAAVAGYMTAQPIGPDGSGLYDEIGGLSAVNTEYRASTAKDFDGVTAVTRTGRLATTETTSTESQFRFIHATEVIDEVSLDLFTEAREYAGGPQDPEELETLLSVQCEANATGSPPNLGFAEDTDADPYNVSVSLGNSNTIANGSVTIVPYPIAEEVNISVTVADGFVEFAGAN